MEYDGWASRYDEDTARFGWSAPRVLLEAVASQNVRPTSVLDLGVGTGQCSGGFVDAGAEVVGVDASEAMLEQARGIGYAALHHLQLGEAPLRTVLGEAGFELVVSCGVLHFVADLEALCAEVSGLLKPGGLFAFTTIPPQTRTFSSATVVRPDTEVAAMLARVGLQREAPSQFVAYHADADPDAPVVYTLWLAQRT